jgi:dicarboxylate/amino acid:cation (Na+ or H+) symporter, DAACS family
MASAGTRASRIVIGLLVGGVLGVVCNAVWGPEHTTLRWFIEHVAVPTGQIFLRLLLMVVMPLVFASVATGIASVGDVRAVGRIGTKTLAFFVGSTIVAAGLGLLVVNVVRPGGSISDALRDELMHTFSAQAAEKTAAAGKADFGINTLVDAFPKNPLKAAVDGDMLAVLVFSVLFGVSLSMLSSERRDRVVELLSSISDVCSNMVGVALQVAPVGVCALVFSMTARFGLSLLLPLAQFMMVVIGVLLLHTVLVLMGVLVLYVRVSPRWFFQVARTSIFTAFSTSSSSATLPTNLKTAIEGMGIPAPIANFVLPIGSTMCMNGTAIFEGIVVLFLCQVFHVDLTVGQQVSVLVLAVVTAIGAAGVPGGSIPLLIGILVGVGVPAEAIAIVLGVDRLLDMSRTTVNVIGDLVGTMVVARSEGWRPQPSSFSSSSSSSSSSG